MKKSIAILFGFALFTTTAFAQATRTWVSGVGDDANPCSRTAPCKTFAGAYSKTAVNGVIDVLDNGGFGAVTISKSLTLQAEGAVASVLVNATNGIVVTAGANDVVIVHNILVEGIGGGLNGIRYLSGKMLIVEGGGIKNFTQNGIDVATNALGCVLTVKDSVIQQNTNGGILIHPTLGTTVRATIDHVRLEKNGFGLRVESNVSAEVRNSLATESATNGFIAVTTFAGNADLTIDSSNATHNGTNGVKADGSTTNVRISNMSIFGNTSQGLSIANSGHIFSFGNNNIVDPGSPVTSTIAQQ
jgi:parallel beta helix pectate lyase-like protein